MVGKCPLTSFYFCKLCYILCICYRTVVNILLCNNNYVRMDNLFFCCCCAVLIAECVDTSM